MIRFVTGRVTHAVAVLLLVSVVLALLLDLAPGDPAYVIAGDRATPEQIEQIHADLELDKPVLERYARWLGDAVTGDLGASYRSKKPVIGLLRERLPVTIQLVVMALAMALLISIPLGMYSAYRQQGLADRLTSLTSSAIISVPPFVVALILVYVFALQLQDTVFGLPATGWKAISDGLVENLRHALLPALTLALILIPPFTRLLRDDMVSTLREDFILAARAKGIGVRRVLLRHALRPSSFSLVTLAAQSIGLLIGGAVVTEVIFALPGTGQLLVDSINARDVTAVQGIVAFIAVVYVLVNTGVDLLYGFLDPRARSVKTVR